MALTIGAPVKEGVFSDLRYVIRDITFDSSYPTAGEALTAADCGLTTVYALVDLGPAGHATLSAGRAGVLVHSGAVESAGQARSGFGGASLVSLID